MLRLSSTDTSGSSLWGGFRSWLKISPAPAPSMSRVFFAKSTSVSQARSLAFQLLALPFS